MSGCCRGLPAKVCIARPYGCADAPTQEPNKMSIEVAQMDAVGRLGVAIKRIEQLKTTARMAKTRLERFADEANAGHVHYDARELKRKIWSAFADFDNAVTEQSK